MGVISVSSGFRPLRWESFVQSMCTFKFVRQSYVDGVGARVIFLGLWVLCPWVFGFRRINLPCCVSLRLCGPEGADGPVGSDDCSILVYQVLAKSTCAHDVALVLVLHAVLHFCAEGRTCFRVFQGTSRRALPGPACQGALFAPSVPKNPARDG